MLGGGRAAAGRDDLAARRRRRAGRRGRRGAGPGRRLRAHGRRQRPVGGVRRAARRPSPSCSTRPAPATRRWLVAMFGDRLPTTPAARRRAVHALHAATDVYTWKLLRRDLHLEPHRDREDHRRPRRRRPGRKHPMTTTAPLAPTSSPSSTAAAPCRPSSAPSAAWSSAATDVTVLAEDSMRRRGASPPAPTFRPWATAPNRPSRRPEDDPYRDWECKNPIAAVRPAARQAVRRPGARLRRRHRRGDRRRPARPRRVLVLRPRGDGRRRGRRPAVRRAVPEPVPAARAGDAAVRPRPAARHAAPLGPAARPRRSPPSPAGSGTKGLAAPQRAPRAASASAPLGALLRPDPPRPPRCSC